MSYRKLEAEKYGEFILSGEVEQDGVVALGDAMLSLGHTWKAEGKQNPIRLTIYSHGGACDAGFHLGATLLRLRDMGFEVITHISGGAYSMGFTIAQFGTRRLIEATAKAHIHTIQASYGMAPEAFHTDSTRKIEILKAQIAGVIAARNTAGKNDAQFWADNYFNGRDFYLSPEECLELGLVDEIVGGFNTLRPQPQAVTTE
jgi:ATP-dependent protease ClpP protease subunit